MGNTFASIVFSLRKLFSCNKVKMLCIGMEQSNIAGSCAGAEKGATKFFNKIKPRCDYAKLLISSQATKTKVVSEMMKVCNSDLAIIMYAGHGGQKQTNKNTDEPDGKNEMIFLYDNSMIDNEIWNIISGAKGRIFLVFDCCHAETMFREYNGKKIDFFENRGNSAKIDLMCWAACSDNEVAYATSMGGFMTSCIVKNINPLLTYDKVWKRIVHDKNLASHESVKQTLLLGDNSKFKNKKIFS